MLYVSSSTLGSEALWSFFQATAAGKSVCVSVYVGANPW